MYFQFSLIKIIIIIKKTYYLLNNYNKAKRKKIKQTLDQLNSKLRQIRL